MRRSEGEHVHTARPTDEYHTVSRIHSTGDFPVRGTHTPNLRLLPYRHVLKLPGLFSTRSGDVCSF